MTTTRANNDAPSRYSLEAAEEPLLEEYEYHEMEANPIEALNMPLFGAFKTHSLIIGLLIGFFVQFSTLGANFLVIALWEDNILARSKTEVVLLSLLWSGFTSFMAILTLGFLRSVITIVFRATIPPEQRGPNMDAILEEVVLHLECRFVIGALVGVCSAWTVMDVFLGMNFQVLFSLATLALSLLWCKVMMQCFTKDERSLINTSNKKEEDPVMVV
jgi:hypothetical protein